VFVPENKLHLVQVGKPVAIKATALKKSLQFSGRIVSINPKSEFVPSGSLSSGEVASFRIKVELNPSDASGTVRLYPGMSVQVTLKK
jgi:multidrug resistance efflux pump